MAVVPIIPEGREIAPALLDRPIHLEVRNKQEEELLNVWRQLSQATADPPLDPDLVFHGEDNITAGCPERKSYLQALPGLACEFSLVFGGHANLKLGAVLGKGDDGVSFVAVNGNVHDEV